MSDLRSYISETEENGGLKRISKKVSPRYEIAAITARMDGREAVLFEDVKSGFSVVTNLIGTRGRFAAAIGAGGNIHKRMVSCINRARAPRLASEARFMENSTAGIGSLPIVTHFAKESGPFITSSIVHAQNPDTKKQNMSFHRLMPMDKNHMTIRMVEGRDLHRCFTDAREHGQDLRVAVTVGVHPAIMIAGAYQSGWGEAEMDIANSLLGGGVQLARAPYSGMRVPAGSEIVIEGRILQDITSPEWMVEMLRTYDHAREQPVLEVERLYHRDSPIYHDILSGYAEHRLLMGMPIESKMYGVLRGAYPQTRQVCLTGGGCNWLHAAVQVKKGADVRGVIAKAFEAHRSLKQVVVVDDDIDPADPASVEYAMATRFQADRDLVVVRNVRGSSLDPSSDQEKLRTAKMGIDATRPAGKRPEGFELARIPRYDTCNPGDYFK